MEFWLSGSPSHELFSFFTMEFWLSGSLSHELFSFFTMEFWLSGSLSHKLFLFSQWNSVDGEFPSTLEYLLYIGFDYDLQLTRH
jgi:hypothetical protein